MFVPEQPDAATIRCPNCQFPNPAGHKYCGHCGQQLHSIPESVSSIINRQLKLELDTRLKDQRVVAVEIAESVYERVTKWAKIFVVLVTLPLGAAVYFIYGQYASLSDLIKSSRSEAERILS